MQIDKKKKKAEVMEQHSVVEPHTQYLTLAALALWDLPPSPATDKQGERSLLITLLSAAPCLQRRRCHSHSSGGGLAMKFGENISKSALAAATECTLLFIHVRCWPRTLSLHFHRAVDSHTLKLHAVPNCVRSLSD